MGRTKALGVAGGYVAAFLLALLFSAIRFKLTDTPDRNASSGMYAFGDMLWFLFAWAGLSAPATAAGLYFLREWRRFWVWLSGAALLTATTGVAAMILFFAGRTRTSGLLGSLASLAVLRVLAAPVFGGLDALCAVVAPENKFRAALGAAVLLELAGFVPVAAFWVLGLR